MQARKREKRTPKPRVWFPGFTDEQQGSISNAGNPHENAAAGIGGDVTSAGHPTGALCSGFKDETSASRDGTAVDDEDVACEAGAKSDTDADKTGCTGFTEERQGNRDSSNAGKPQENAAADKGGDAASTGQPNTGRSPRSEVEDETSSSSSSSRDGIATSDEDMEFGAEVKSDLDSDLDSNSKTKVSLDSIAGSIEDLRETLRDIRGLMEKYADKHEQQSKEGKAEKLQQSINEMASVIAVMAVFIAAIGAALLSYTNDVYANRSSSDTPGPPPGEKATDKVTISCLFASIIFALAPASFAGLSKHKATVRMLYRIRRWIMGSPVKLSEGSAGDRTLGMMGYRDKRGKVHMFVMPGNTTRRASQDNPKSPSDGKQGIVNDGPVWILSFLAPSLALLTTGLVVFCWAEQPRAVAYAATSALGYSTLRVAVFAIHSVMLAGAEPQEGEGGGGKGTDLTDEDLLKTFQEDIDVRYQYVRGPNHRQTYMQFAS